MLHNFIADFYTMLALTGGLGLLLKFCGCFLLLTFMVGLLFEGHKTIQYKWIDPRCGTVEFSFHVFIAALVFILLEAILGGVMWLAILVPIPF